jgi:hypothetical protein
MELALMRRALAVLAAMLIVSLIVAASACAQAPDFSKVEIKTNRVTDNFYTLDGQGGRIGTLAGPGCDDLRARRIARSADQLAEVFVAACVVAVHMCVYHEAHRLRLESFPGGNGRRPWPLRRSRFRS